MTLNKPNKAIGPQVRQKPHKRFNLPLIGLAVIFSLLISMQIATQYVAYKLHYHESLGDSLANAYLPWQVLFWNLKYHAYYPDYFNVAFGLMVMCGSVCLMAIVFAEKQLQKENVSEYLHGSARWANREDLKDAGLIGHDEGVYVGAIEDETGEIHYLRHNGPEHILTYAPTRSGKGVGLVIPTLLSWKHSCVITDLKGELWALTAGWRQKHANNKVIRFEPATLKGSARWNPLNEIRVGTESEVGDVQNLATLVVDPEGKGLESHWQKTSQALLVGFILHAIYKLKNQGEPATFPNIDRMLVDPNTNIADLLIEMTQYPHIEGKTHPVISASARDMIDRPEEEAGSVLSTLKSYLALYRDPVVAFNVSDFGFLYPQFDEPCQAR
jgi:type IV secretion system protein VirD4